MQSNHRANALAVVYHELRAAFDRRTIGYDRARRAFVEQRAAALRTSRWIFDNMWRDALWLMRSTSKMEVRCGIAMITAMSCTIVAERFVVSKLVRLCTEGVSSPIGDDAAAFFDEQGVRVVNPPDWMQFN